LHAIALVVMVVITLQLITINIGTRRTDRLWPSAGLGRGSSNRCGSPDTLTNTSRRHPAVSLAQRPFIACGNGRGLIEGDCLCAVALRTCARLWPHHCANLDRCSAPLEIGLSSGSICHVRTRCLWGSPPCECLRKVTNGSEILVPSAFQLPYNPVGIAFSLAFRARRAGWPIARRACHGRRAHPAQPDAGKKT
jgi:hypothetical protein